MRDQVGREEEIADTAALCAGLIDTVVPAERIGQGTTFRDGHGTRLFTVHVLACLGSRDGRHRVPAITGGDQHRIDVGTCEDLVQIAVHGTVSMAVVRIRHLLDGFALHLLHVTDRDELDVAVLQEVAQVFATAAPNPDGTEHGAIAGATAPLRPRAEPGIAMGIASAAPAQPTRPRNLRREYLAQLSVIV